MERTDLMTKVWEFDGLAPSGNSRRTFYLHKSKLLGHFDETINLSMRAEAWLIGDVLSNPSGIFENLTRGGQEEALCYSGIPTGEFAQTYGVSVELRNGVFLVFVSAGMEIAKWRWCEEAPDHPGFPVDHQTRFGVQLWPPEMT